MKKQGGTVTVGSRAISRALNSLAQWVGVQCWCAGWCVMVCDHDKISMVCDHDEISMVMKAIHVESKEGMCSGGYI
jgi:hypothetical protein